MQRRKYSCRRYFFPLMKEGDYMLIVFEGIDGSGKSMIARRLYEHLYSTHHSNVWLASYPNYKSPTGELVKQYLSGVFGSDPKTENPYFISMLYAIDHWHFYQNTWKTLYDSKQIIIMDRYTTSNLYYSAVNEQFKNDGEIIRFQKHIVQMEHTWMHMPEPDILFYLDMPSSISVKLRKSRMHNTGGITGDINENNLKFLENVNKQGKRMVRRIASLFPNTSAKIISCTQNGNLRSPEDILADILIHIRVVSSFANPTASTQREDI